MCADAAAMVQEICERQRFWGEISFLGPTAWVHVCVCGSVRVKGVNGNRVGIASVFWEEGCRGHAWVWFCCAYVCVVCAMSLCTPMAHALVEGFWGVLCAGERELAPERERQGGVTGTDAGDGVCVGGGLLVGGSVGNGIRQVGGGIWHASAEGRGCGAKDLMCWVHQCLCMVQIVHVCV